MKMVSTAEATSTTTTTAPARSRVGRKLGWLALLILLLAALLMVLTPAWLIQPFRAQSQGGLAASYTLRRWSPVMTLVFSTLVLALVLWLWRGARRWWLKSVLVATLALTLAATWFARQNHFEWMFNPLSNGAYARADAVDFVADTDMVLAIEVGGEAVAYPVRLMAYHHVVQDMVGGTAVVATY